MATVDAGDLEVGDIIAVGRPNGTPIIHRITSVETVDGTRAATMRGDANSSDDPNPVVLTGTGDRLVYYVPFAGYLLWAIKSPLLLTVAAVVIMAVWAAGFRHRDSESQQHSALSGP